MTEYPQSLGLSGGPDLTHTGSPDSTYSIASSYGSVDSGVSYPPRARSKRRKRVDITWDEFTGQTYGEEAFSIASDELQEPASPQSQPQQHQQRRPYEYGTNGDDLYRVNLPTMKKVSQASKSCDSCRQLKAKCDNAKPCWMCIEKGVECKYRDPFPKATSTDKAQVDMLDGLNAVQNTLRTLVNQLSHFDQRLCKLEALLPKPVAEEKYKHPVNHTTLTSSPLKWPSIRELIRHHLEKEGVRHISEYPMRWEQNRGVLLVHGRGEDCSTPRAMEEHTGHVNPDMAKVNLEFSESKVWMYVESFKENILNMHPIIQPAMLDDWVRHFLDTLPYPRNRSTKPQNSKSAFAFVSGGSQTPTPKEAIGLKRKRSPGLDGPEPPTPVPTRPGRPDRSIHSALVLTVLALGKICLHWSNIPQVSTGDRNGDQYGGIPTLPSLGSPPQLSNSSGLPSPKEFERMFPGRRSPIQGVVSSRPRSKRKKNYELIPGLEYFAFATDILGNHTGGYDNMKIVYALVFAGLYHGQLGRPMESFAFNHKASHKLQVIMRPSLDIFRRIKRSGQAIQKPRYNQLALSFWTCLQLESDLIAELQLPPSGLHSYEGDMPRPNMSLLEGYNQRVLDSYLAHLYLRTHLNSIQRAFHASEDPTNQSGEDEFKNVSLVADAVSGMHWVAPSFAFKEDDPPAEDLLSARLRAKYWDTQVIIYRPFVRRILQFSHSLRNHTSSSSFPTVSPGFRHNVIAPAIDPKGRFQGEIEPQMVELAKRGVKALIESTRALYNISDKQSIITDVFGTAHAQWGNLLVLSAAFRDPVLNSYVDRDVLQTLFAKTITFLRQSATATSSLRIDMHVLEGIESDLFHSAG